MAWNILSRKARSPHRRCGLPVACFSEGEAVRRTRLPVALLSRAGGKNPVYRPFLLARHLHISYHGSNIRLCPGWAQGTTSINFLGKVLARPILGMKRTAKAGLLISGFVFFDCKAFSDTRWGSGWFGIVPFI